MTQLFPEVIDGSTLGASPSSPIFLPIGIEGQSDSAGSIAANVVKLVSRISEAQDYFGPASSLTALISHVLNRGAGPVYAIASKKGSAPSLVERQASWQTLEASREIRIRLTDTGVQANLVALGASCDNANLINNKQFAFGGMPAATTKASLITAAGAISNKRVVLVGPAVYDDGGVLVTGVYAAASAAAAVAINDDPADDLDTFTLPKLSGLEKDANGNDIFRQIVVGGVVQNDFEDLLQGGVSPLMRGLDGGVAISHLRTTYTVDGTFDALMTRIIMDQQFVLVRDTAMRFNSLRKGNTPDTRGQLASRIDALLKRISDWIQPVELGDGTTGYGVVVESADAGRRQVISYQGAIVRGTQTILVAPNFTISV